MSMEAARRILALEERVVRLEHLVDVMSAELARQQQTLRRSTGPHEAEIAIAETEATAPIGKPAKPNGREKRTG